MTKSEIIMVAGLSSVFFGLWQESVNAGCFLWFLMLWAYPAYLRYIGEA